jgi:hypothetical protein
MAKADITEVIGRKNGHTVQYLVSIEESVPKLKMIINFVAPELEVDLGYQYLANWKILAKSVEVPESWLPHKIINKKIK